MTRQKDIADARAAADDWAAERGLPPSGGYSADWYVNGYLDGQWPANWVKWWAAYTNANGFPPPGSILGGDIVGHQYTSRPVDMNEFLDSEVVSHTPVGDPTADEFRQAMAYLWNDVVEPLSTYKLARVKAAVAELKRVFEQYGAI